MRRLTIKPSLVVLAVISALLLMPVQAADTEKNSKVQGKTTTLPTATAEDFIITQPPQPCSPVAGQQQQVHQLSGQACGQPDTPPLPPSFCTLFRGCLQIQANNFFTGLEQETRKLGRNIRNAALGTMTRLRGHSNPPAPSMPDPTSTFNENCCIYKEADDLQEELPEKKPALPPPRAPTTASNGTFHHQQASGTNSRKRIQTLEESGEKIYEVVGSCSSVSSTAPTPLTSPARTHHELPHLSPTEAIARIGKISTRLKPRLLFPSLNIDAKFNENHRLDDRTLLRIKKSRLLWKLFTQFNRELQQKTISRYISLSKQNPGALETLAERLVNFTYIVNIVLAARDTGKVDNLESRFDNLEITSFSLDNLQGSIDSPLRSTPYADMGNLVHPATHEIVRDYNTIIFYRRQFLLRHESELQPEFAQPVVKVIEPNDLQTGVPQHKFCNTEWGIDQTIPEDWAPHSTNDDGAKTTHSFWVRFLSPEHLHEGLRALYSHCLLVIVKQHHLHRALEDLHIIYETALRPMQVASIETLSAMEVFISLLFGANPILLHDKFNVRFFYEYMDSGIVRKVTANAMARSKEASSMASLPSTLKTDEWEYSDGVNATSTTTLTCPDKELEMAIQKAIEEEETTAPNL